MWTAPPDCVLSRYQFVSDADVGLPSRNCASPTPTVELAAAAGIAGPNTNAATKAAPLSILSFALIRARLPAVRMMRPLSAANLWHGARGYTLTRQSVHERAIAADSRL